MRKRALIFTPRPRGPKRICAYSFIITVRQGKARVILKEGGKITDIIDKIRNEKMFENCLGIFTFLNELFGSSEEVINGVAGTEEEPIAPALTRQSITAFALGFYLGFISNKIVMDLFSKISAEKGMAKEILFSFHLTQLQKKLQNAGVLPIGQNSWVS